MNDAELNEVLKRATVPEREADYWERFPGRVMAELERRRQAASSHEPECEINGPLSLSLSPSKGERVPKAGEGAVWGFKARIASRDSLPAKTLASPAWSWTGALRMLLSRPALAAGVAVVCLGLAFFLGLRRGQRSLSDDPQLAAARKYYDEIEALFPNQVQAIVFDQRGTHLVLAKEPNVPASPPLYLKVCGPKGCQRFVTFSGQQIRVNGDVCDVLADGRGEVLLVGRQLLWSGAEAVAASGGYQVEARTLENRL